MLSLYSQTDHSGTSPAEKLFGHNLRTILPLLIPSNQSVVTEKHTITQNLRRKLPKIAPGTTVRIRTDLWDKILSQNNRPRPYDILNEKGNTLARNRRHLIPTTEKFNIKHDYDNFFHTSKQHIYSFVFND